MAQDEVIKEVRVRGKISMKGNRWSGGSGEKEDSTGENDFKLTVTKRGRKDYLITLQRIGGKGFGVINGVGQDFDVKIGPVQEIKNIDELIKLFFYDPDEKIYSKNKLKTLLYNDSFVFLYSFFVGEMQRVPGGPKLKEFINFWIEKKGFTDQNADTNFFEIVQDPYDEAVVPPFPAGYFDIWNEWDALYKKWNEESEQFNANKKPDSPLPSAASSEPLPEVDLYGVKVTLTKVSGPGEVVGVVEQSSDDDGKVVFSKLQFSAPGEYVISAQASIPEVAIGTFSIKIEKEDEVIAQDSKGSTQSVEGNRPIIAQIDKTNYSLPPITFDIQTQNKTTTGADENKEIANSTGFRPLLSYNGAIIREKDIRMLDIFCVGLSPRCQATFADSQGLVTSGDFRPTNDTKFDVFFTSNSAHLKPIHMRMKIESWEQDKKNNGVTFYGILDIPEFYKINSKAYDGTSFEVLRTLCKELSLGYNSNIENTDDKMVWKGQNKMYGEFMENIIKHSYISDDSFTGGYIDFYYCFNYVDIEKEWNRDIANDIMIDSMSINSVEPKLKETTTQLYLTNDFSMANSSVYFAQWEPINDSTEITSKKGQFEQLTYYDRQSKQIIEFDIKSLVSKAKNLLPLKGAKMDDDEHRTNFRTKFRGFIDTENTHKNYLYAPSQNEQNMLNLAKVKATLILPNPNMNLYRFQKIKVNFIVQKKTTNENKDVDHRLSGEWIITKISLNWKGKKLVQTLEVWRKEYGKTPEESAGEKEKQDTTNNNNKNPQASTASTPTGERPNDEYEEGKEYTIVDERGLRYLIKVDKKLENGNDISATIRPLDGKGPYLKPTESPTDTATASATASGTASLTGTGSTGTASNTGASSTEPEDFTKVEFSIAIDEELMDPKDVDFYKTVVGKINFESSSSTANGINRPYTAVAELSGFKDGSKVTRLKSPIQLLITDVERVAEGFILYIEMEIKKNPKYKKDISLKITGKKIQ